MPFTSSCSPRREAQILAFGAHRPSRRIRSFRQGVLRFFALVIRRFGGTKRRKSRGYLSIDSTFSPGSGERLLMSDQKKEDKFAVFAEADGQSKPLIMTHLTFARLMDDVVLPYQ